MPYEEIERLSKLGLVGILILILILLYTGKLRWGQDYDKIEAERDRWMRAALKGTEIAKHAVRVVDKTALKKEKHERANESDD